MSCPQAQQPPYFLVGPERAGTTMLRLMLQRHPCIAWNSESEYFVDWVADDGSWPALESYYDRLKRDRQYGNDRIFAGHRFQIDRTLDYPLLVRSFLEQARCRQGAKPLAGATVHRHFNRLLWIWPDAKFIKITRDGRDVARSAMGMGWYGNMWAACDRWLDAERRWDQLRGKLPADRFIEISYEELVTRPHQVLAGLCAFMGLEFEPVMLTYEQSSGYEYPHPKYALQWKRKLSEPEIRLAEARMGDLLLRRGYELSGLPPLHVGPLWRTWLKVTDRIGRTRFRLRQFGFPLVMVSFLGRRLGVRGLEERVWARMNEIVNAGLKR